MEADVGHTGGDSAAADAGDRRQASRENLVLRAEADYADPDPALRQLIADLPLQPGDRVLDLGCGAGQFAAFIAERVGAAGEVVGIDPDEEALTLAQELLNLHRPDLTGRAVFAPGRAEDIPAEDAAFDLVWLSLVIHHHADADKRRTLREIRRVLRPGGWVAIRDGDVAALEPILPLPARLRARLATIFAEAETPGEGFAPLGGPRDLATGRALPRLLREAGFDRWTVRAYNHVYRHPLSESDLRVLKSTLVTGWRGQVLQPRLDPAERAQLNAYFTPGHPDSWLDDPGFHAFKPDIVYLARR